MSHRGATGFKPPAAISFNPIAPNKSLASSLVNHELDIAHVASPWVLRDNALDRSSRIPGSGGNWDNVKPLLPDRMAEGARVFLRNTDFSLLTMPISFAVTSIGSIRGPPLTCTTLS